MARIAFIFPGQGAQYCGMGKELTECSKAAKEVFDTAEALKAGISKLCFSGSDDELKQTKNAQPCIFLTEIAAMEAIKEEGILPEAVAGFSLGELSAVYASGLLSFEECFSLVEKRGEIMDRAAIENPAFMAAILRLDSETVEELCSEFQEVYPVNYNCPGQISVSGKKSEMDSFFSAVKEAGGRCVPLKVSGGFHSPFMKKASEEFGNCLSEGKFKKASIPIYSDIDGEIYNDDPAELLAKQISSPVHWESIIRNMIIKGIDTFVELGPGNTLSGMIQRIDAKVTVLHVEDQKSLKECITALQ